MQERETGEAYVVGVQLARLLKAEERRVDQRAARIENHDLLPGAHCHRREIRRGNGHASKQDGKDHPEPGGNQVVRDGCDGGEFHTGLVAGSGGGPIGCAFEECELNAACAAYGVKMLPLWCEIVLRAESVTVNESAAA